MLQLILGMGITSVGSFIVYKKYQKSLKKVKIDR